MGPKFVEGGKSFAEVVKKLSFGDDVVAMEIEEKDYGKILESMDYCLVGGWRVKTSLF